MNLVNLGVQDPGEEKPGSDTLGVPLVGDGHDDEDGDGEHNVVHGVEGLIHTYIINK